MISRIEKIHEASRDANTKLLLGQENSAILFDAQEVEFKIDFFRN